MPLGLSFAPGQNDDTNRMGGGQAQTPVQEAIRILSLRLPRLLGAGAPTSPALMGGPGGMARGSAGLGGPPSNPIIEQLLRAIFGGAAVPPQGLVWKARALSSTT